MLSWIIFFRLGTAWSLGVSWQHRQGCLSGGSSKTASHKQGDGHRCEGLTCKLVQVNGKWNAFSTCLLYLLENATHCHYIAILKLHSHCRTTMISNRTG